MLKKTLITTILLVSIITIGFAQLEVRSIEPIFEGEMYQGEKMDWITTPEGLKYRILEEGWGEIANNGDNVSVHYTGTLTDGTKFDSSLDRGQPFEFPLGRGRVIKGWDIGVAGMAIGEKRELYIPSELGYGSRGAGRQIPPNTDLIFTVELLGIK